MYTKLFAPALSLAFLMPINVFSKNLTMDISGLIETELSAGQDFSGNDVSDIVLATAELEIYSQLNPAVGAKVSFLYEEDDTDLEVDQALLTLTPRPNIQINLGQMYLPFGHYQSAQISDPLTLELGEVRESSLLVNLLSSAVSASIFVFNGNINKSEDKVSSIGVSLAKQYLQKRLNLHASYTSNLADGDAYGNLETLGEITNHAGALSVFVSYEMASVKFIGETVKANEDIVFGTRRIKPSASNIETIYTMANKASIALSWQQSEQAGIIELPKRSLRLTYAITALEDAANLAFEYRKDRDYSQEIGSTGESANMFTVQLAAEL